jgi:hypothetical protein
MLQCRRIKKLFADTLIEPRCGENTVQREKNVQRTTPRVEKLRALRLAPPLYPREPEMIA